MTNHHEDSGWLYVAAVIDLFSRRVVGWSMRAAMTAQLVTDALVMAIWRRGKPDALLHHSDRGSQYTSEQFQKLMADHGVVCSMSRSGNVWDNAAMESFFSSLKTERTGRKTYRTRDEARADIFDYIERFYNPKRRHSTIGYLSPSFLITCRVIETNERGVEQLTRETIPKSERNQEMQKFAVHTIESAPEKSRQPLQVLKQKFGFVPNVAGTMAASPVLINAFIGGFASFHGGSFSESEKQALLLTNAVTLRCPWAVAFHSSMALREGVPEGDVRAIRDGRLPTDVKYAALSGMAKALIEKRGNVTETDIENFTSAGYSQVQILEVITGIGMSAMASTTGNLAGTPVEDHLKAQTWAAV